jgi:hypothetical protein
MNKADTKQAKAEIRTLKATLNKRQKEIAKDVARNRRIIRSSEIIISNLDRESTRLLKATTDRLAILEGRINS